MHFSAIRTCQQRKECAKLINSKILPNLSVRSNERTEDNDYNNKKIRFRYKKCLGYIYLTPTSVPTQLETMLKILPNPDLIFTLVCKTKLALYPHKIKTAPTQIAINFLLMLRKCAIFLFSSQTCPFSCPIFSLSSFSAFSIISHYTAVRKVTWCFRNRVVALSTRLSPLNCWPRKSKRNVVICKHTMSGFMTLLNRCNFLRSITWQQRYYRTATLRRKRTCYILCVPVSLKVVLSFNYYLIFFMPKPTFGCSFSICICFYTTILKL